MRRKLNFARIHGETAIFAINNKHVGLHIKKTHCCRKTMLFCAKNFYILEFLPAWERDGRQLPPYRSSGAHVMRP